MHQFSELSSFIDRAVKDRKYAVNTAHGHKAALNLFQKELTDEEKGSVDLIDRHIVEIYKNVCRNNAGISSQSLDTYRIRFQKVIKDYKNYGADPTKMKEWKVRTRIAKPKEKKADFSDSKIDSSPNELSEVINNPVHKIELALRDGEKFVLSIPRDINEREAKIITDLINSLIIP